MKIATALAFISLSIVSICSQAQDITNPDNQCRTEAKEVAIKTYQSCMASARTNRIEQIRKDYQEKLAQLKKQYEGQIQELKKTNPPPTPESRTGQVESIKTETLSPQPSKVLGSKSKFEASGSYRESEPLQVVDPALPTQTQ